MTPTLGLLPSEKDTRTRASALGKDPGYLKAYEKKRPNLSESLCVQTLAFALFFKLPPTINMYRRL